MRSFSLALLFAVATIPAQAAIVSYQFTASVNSIAEIPGDTDTVNFLSSSSLAGPRISIGDSWTGTFSYDTDMQLGTYQPPQPAQGAHTMYKGFAQTTIKDARTGLSFESTLPYPWSTGSLIIWNEATNVGSDIFWMYSESNASANGNEFGSVWLNDRNGSTFGDATIPLALSLNDFLSASVSYEFSQRGTGNYMHAEAWLLSLTPVIAVPEPATYAMLALGLAFIGARRQRCHSKVNDRGIR